MIIKCPFEKQIFIPESPYSIWFPDEAKYCNKKDINLLHLDTCKNLDIYDVYLKLIWKFEPAFRCTLGQAEWDDDGNWWIRYASRFWLPLGELGRRNTIVHEVCHLAVERLYGHCSRPKAGQERVLDHGIHWRNLMEKCGEDPDLEII
jgi:hypothetical protein